MRTTIKFKAVLYPGDKQHTVIKVTETDYCSVPADRVDQVVAELNKAFDKSGQVKPV